MKNLEKNLWRRHLINMAKTVKRLVLLFILCCFSSCQTKQEINNDEIKENRENNPKTEEKKENYYESFEYRYDLKLSILEGKALKEGNLAAYRQLKRYRNANKEESKLLYIALIMANRHDLAEAHMDVVYCLTNGQVPVLEGVLDSLDKKTKEMLIVYLKNAVRTDHPDAKYILGELHIEGKHVEKNEELGKKLIEEGNIYSNLRFFFE